MGDHHAVSFILYWSVKIFFFFFNLEYYLRCIQFSLDICYLNDPVFIVPEEKESLVNCYTLYRGEEATLTQGRLSSLVAPSCLERDNALFPFSTGNSDWENGTTFHQVYSLGNISIGEPTEREAPEIYLNIHAYLDFPGGANGKEPDCQCRCKAFRFDPCVGKILWRREGMHPTPVFLPEQSHGEESSAGYSHRVTKSQTWL